MPFLIPYITIKSTYSFLSPCFKIPNHLFARIWLLQQIITPKGIGQQSGGTTEGLPHLYDFPIVICISLEGVWYGVGCSHKKSILNHWLTDESVLWDSTLEPQPLLVYLRANNTLCWAKAWILHHGVDCWFMPCIVKAL